MTVAKPRVVVVGAGAFGGWTGLELRRRGADVTVIDAWGPGHARASSGGETRVIRAAYGSRAHYSRMTARALTRWRDLEALTGRRVFHRTGVLWMFGGAAAAQAFADASIDALAAQGAPLEVLTPGDGSSRYPQIDFRDIALVLFEPEAGYLMARRACEDVLEQLQREGGSYRLAAAAHPIRIGQLQKGRLALGDGTELEADIFVLACGPWLASLVPDILGALITPTRQEVYYFGPPPGDARFSDNGLPAWIEVSGDQIYGIPGNAHRGFKIANDRPGPVIEPTTLERDATPAGIAAIRSYLGRRFPALASAPLAGAEVCQYEASPDSELIIDTHPSSDRVWLVGGGSGHGFKLGPAVAEQVASAVLNGAETDPRFSLSRFREPRPGGWEEKWK